MLNSFQTQSFLAAQVLSRTIAYLEKNPEENFPKTLKRRQNICSAKKT
jgi:hypothetical protein